jgi:hypothetical protein
MALAALSIIVAKSFLSMKREIENLLHKLNEKNVAEREAKLKFYAFQINRKSPRNMNARLAIFF